MSCVSVHLLARLVWVRFRSASFCASCPRAFAPSLFSRWSGSSATCFVGLRSSTWPVVPGLGRFCFSGCLLHRALLLGRGCFASFPPPCPRWRAALCCPFSLLRCPGVAFSLGLLLSRLAVLCALCFCVFYRVPPGRPSALCFGLPGFSISGHFFWALVVRSRWFTSQSVASVLFVRVLPSFFMVRGAWGLALRPLHSRVLFA